VNENPLNLNGLLSAGPPSFELVQDGEEVAAACLAETASRLADALRGRGQAACSSGRAVEVLATLLAGEAAGCRVVLAQDPAFLPQDPVGGAAGPGILVATSGTSGRPKVAEHTLETLMGRIRTRERARGRAAWLLTFHPASFAGLQVQLTALAMGDRLVAMEDAGLVGLSEAARRHEVTHISATPTFWRGAAPLLVGEDAGFRLKQITLGGEAADQPVLDELKRRFPSAALCHIYAATETGALFSVRDGKAGFPAAWLDAGVEGVSLRMREGVLEVLSPRRMKGYLDGGGACAMSGERWLRTGDIVEVAGDRVLFRGREDGRINVGGGKVDPAAVEAALMDVPGVADLRIFGVSSPISGQLVGVEVVPRPGAEKDELRNLLERRAREVLRHHEIPRVFKFVDAVRLSGSGKKSRRAEEGS